MGKASAVKGAQAERDAKRLLNELLGRDDIDRKLGAGRREDKGDIHGLDGFTIQVAARAELGQVLRHKTRECEVQQGHAQTPYGATLMKLPPLPGGKPQEWRFVLTPEQFAQIWHGLAGAHGWPQ